VLFEREGESTRGLQVNFADLVFARQLIHRCVRLAAPDENDRATPIVEAARRYGHRFGEVWVETPDNDRAKERLGFCSRFTAPLSEALQVAGLLGGGARSPRLHVCFDESGEVFVGLSTPGRSSPWPMGIPRLRMPEGAPSRSALKLMEAIVVFIGEDASVDRLRAGRAAVDLGAAPGGWSFVLANRGMRVLAVDNGPIAPAVLATEMVEHSREDAFRFRPRWPVDWMVCDVVTQPSRIAALVVKWAVQGWCRETIFNLKLPMKRRYEEVVQLRDLILRETKRAGIKVELHMKQLYHDRQEITAHLRRMQ
jgi:23S rRNA (cytidine2498-2'-O)-methyltransferase